MKEENVLSFRDRFRKEVIPSWYTGIGHLLFNASCLLGVFFYLVFQVNSPSALEWLTIPVTLIIGNLGVYCIHRFPLHRSYKFLSPHTYKVHTKWHHHFYTDKMVIYDSPRDFYILFFPPTVIILFCAIYIPLNYVIVSPFLSDNVTFLYLATSTLYFILYEVLHFISHLPEDHFVLTKLPLFKKMWRHHVDHHNPRLMHDYNFNIVFPFFDYIFGTVYRGEGRK